MSEQDNLVVDLDLRKRTFLWLAEVVNMTTANSKRAEDSFSEVVISILKSIDEVIKSVVKEEDGTIVIDIRVGDVWRMLRSHGLIFKTKPTFFVLLEVQKIMDQEALPKLVEYL